jgi:hypothetical protein
LIIDSASASVVENPACASASACLTSCVPDLST